MLPANFPGSSSAPWQVPLMKARVIEVCQDKAVVLVHVQPGEDCYHIEQVTLHNEGGRWLVSAMDCDR